MNIAMLDRDPSWMARATDEQLAAFYRLLDANLNHPNHNYLLAAVTKESDKRASAYYDSIGGGEWL